MMKTQFTDFWYSGKTPRSSRCSEKKQVQLPESPKKPKTRSFGEKKRKRRKPILSRLRNR